MQLLYFWNPNVQYGAASFRETKYSLDRIYGIMQIYDLSLPGPPKGQTITLEELEEQFAEAVNVQSPVLGQALVNLKPPRVGKSWQITQKSRVPYMLVQMPEDLIYDSKFRKDSSGRATLEGPACSLESLEKPWVHLTTLMGRRYGAAIELDYSARFLLSEFAPEEDWAGELDNPYYPSLHANACQALMDIFPPNELQVISLGKTCYISLSDPEIENKSFVGLIMYKDGYDGQWHRIGVCQWQEIHKISLKPLVSHQPGWKTTTFELH